MSFTAYLKKVAPEATVAVGLLSLGAGAGIGVTMPHTCDAKQRQNQQRVAFGLIGTGAVASTYGNLAKKDSPSR